MRSQFCKRRDMTCRNGVHRLSAPEGTCIAGSIYLFLFFFSFWREITAQLHYAPIPHTLPHSDIIEVSHMSPMWRAQSALCQHNKSTDSARQPLMQAGFHEKGREAINSGIKGQGPSGMCVIKWVESGAKSDVVSHRRCRHQALVFFDLKEGQHCYRCTDQLCSL